MIKVEFYSPNNFNQNYTIIDHESNHDKKQLMRCCFEKCEKKGIIYSQY